MLWLWQLKGIPTWSATIASLLLACTRPVSTTFPVSSMAASICLGQNDFKVNSFPLSLGDESFGRFPTSVDFFSKDLPRYKLSEASLWTSSTKSRTSWTFRQLSETNDKSIISWAMSKVKILFSSDHLWSYTKTEKLLREWPSPLFLCSPLVQ